MEQFVITFDEIRALLVEQQYAEKDIEELEKAFEFAKKLHSGQYRFSTLYHTPDGSCKDFDSFKS